MDRISGAYPGGPTGQAGLGQSGSEEPPRAIRTAEDRARMADRRSQDDRLRSRRVRAALGVSTALVLSAAAGISWGLISAARASDEMVEWEDGGMTLPMIERNDGGRTRPEDQLSRELDRLVNELWKMEELERLPRR